MRKSNRGWEREKRGFLQSSFLTCKKMYEDLTVFSTIKYVFASVQDEYKKSKNNLADNSIGID